jgi:hypothetical protein
MKAKKVYEALGDVLIPKSKEEVSTALKSLSSPQHQFNLACKNGFVEEVKKLIKNPKVDPNYSSGMCIFYAVDTEKYDLVEVLLNDERVRKFASDHLRDFLLMTAKAKYPKMFNLLKKYKI